SRTLRILHSFPTRRSSDLMIPLALCSVLAVYVFVERFIAIRKAGKTVPDFLARIREKVSDGNLDAAKSLCKNYEGSIPRVIHKGDRKSTRLNSSHVKISYA